MLSPLASADRIAILPAVHPLGQHWLRRSLRTDCAPVVKVKGAGPAGELRPRQARFSSLADDLRHFLMAYIASLVAAAVFLG
jgi:hypothetical protein